MAYPTLNSNEITSALYNQIIAISTEAKNIAGTYGKLLEAMRIEGGMYGDTKLVIDTDCLESYDFEADTQDQCNVLATHRPPAPSTQAIVLDKFRQCAVTIDDYLSKRAFADEGSFAGFNGVIRGWVADTKKVYDSTTFNAFVGTAESTVQTGITIDPDDYPSIGQGIGEVLADLLVNMGDVTREYNDLGFLRSFAEEDILVLWNAPYVNKIRKIDEPALFHKEGLVAKLGEYVLPARYFGTVATASDVGSGKIIKADGSYDNTKGTLRALEEGVIGTGANRHHYFAGDEIVNGEVVYASSKFVIPCYIENAKVICKVMAKGSVPFMSSFSVGTSFVNPKNLSENQYLTWSHNTLTHLAGKPFVTIKEA